MKCIYQFNNKVFDSELKLDEEIIKLLQFSHNVHDLVFSRKYSETSEKNYKALMEIDRISRELQQLNQTKEDNNPNDIENWRNNAYFGLDDPILENKKLYATVTNTMQGLQVYHEDGVKHPLFPIWRSADYWSRMKDKLMHLTDWIDKPDPENGKVWITKEFVEFMFGDETPHDLTEPELAFYAERMEKGVWASQATVGNLTHGLLRIIFEQFFEEISSVNEGNIDALVDKIYKFTPPDKHPDKQYLTTAWQFQNAKDKNHGYDICQNEKSLLKSVVVEAKKIVKEIRKKCPSNPRVFCEIRVTGDTTKEYNPLKVLGQLDLIVIDDDGNIEIFDYKCSPKEYSQFDSAKKRTFMYQLSIYRRLVEQLNLIHQKAIGINIIPIQFLDFNYQDDGFGSSPAKTGRVSISGIKLNYSGKNYSNIIKDLDKEIDSSIDENLNIIMPVAKKAQDSDNIASNVQEFLSKVFPEYADFRDYSDESKLDKRITDFIERNGGIQKDQTVNNKYYLHIKRSKRTYEGESEVDIFDQIKQEWRKAAGSAQERAKKLHKALFEAQNDYATFQHKSIGKLHDPENGSYQWAEKVLKKYATPEWEVITETTEYFNPEVVKILTAHGVILAKNKFSNVIDVIKCSGDNLFAPNYLTSPSGKSKYLLGTFLTDDQQTGQQDSLTLEAVNGNIELMEVMALLNQIPGTLGKFGGMIGEIKVLNTDGSKGIGGISASNEQLLYNFNRLYTLGGFKDNNLSANAGLNQKGPIKFCSYTDLVAKQFLAIKEKQKDDDNFNIFDESVISLGDSLHQSVLNNSNKEAQIIELTKLKEELEDSFPELKGKPITDIDYIQHPESIIYNNILQAIAELSGVQIVQQIENHPKYFDHISTILQQGLNGSYTDNPGTLKSPNLNKMAYITERGYQNVRVAVTKFNEELHKELQEYKQAKSFGWGQKVTVGNQASLYKNLYDEEAKKNGLFQFKKLNDPSLLPAEQKFLNFAVRKLALDRYGSQVMTDNKFDEAKFMAIYNANPDEVLQVPLIRASFGSTVASSGGLLNAIKVVFRNLLPSNIKKYLSGKVYEFLDTSGEKGNQKSKAKAGELYEMINRIKNSYNPELRDKLLTTYDSDTKQVINNIDQYEINLERLLLSSNMALNMEKELNKIFPTLKAIVVGLSMQGIIQNTEFDKDIQYATDYIKNKIHGLPLEDIESFGVARLLGTELMSMTSKVALAFNPLQLYQIIDGLWKDIMLILQKPDVAIPDDSVFTKKNMVDSFFWITKDAYSHWGDKPSLGEALNRLYGINDMDINVFQDRISSDNAGFFNFWSLGFRFSSRPDYYNRMTIFGAQMRKDGSFEAHSIDDSGKLIYDWKKDKRFDLYANQKEVGSEKWKQQKALYLTMAQEFIKEGATNNDGSLFMLGDDSNPTALPRAYTTQQSESMKALGDKIYGYYSHEKRSMLQSYTLGALFMQMHTYWSSKKNQYLTGHGFTQQGNYEQYKQIQADGSVKEYWLDENGLPTEENTGVPFMVWQGRPQEGIVVTLMHLLHDLAIGEHDEKGDILTDENGNQLKGWSYMFDKNFGEHTDKKLKALYRANMTQLGYDLFMFLLMGMLIAPSLLTATQKYTKEQGNSNLNQAIVNTSLLGLVKMFKTSTDDFNMIKSIGGQVVDWDPFSLSMLKNLTRQSKDLLFSDRDSYDILTNIFAASRNTKPLFDYVKIQTTGRAIGEKAAA